MQFLDWLKGRKKKEQPEVETPALSETLKANIAKMQRLPTLPQGATRAMAVARDADVTIEKLAGVIETDPALAASVLKMANSPLFGKKWPSQTLQQAVVKIGLRECYNLILAVATRSLFRHLPHAEQNRYQDLWQHSFLTACVCRQLNQQLRLGYAGEEFACGLTHDIGRVLIAVGLPEQFSTIDALDFVEDADILNREQAALGADHCSIGAWYGNENQLPASVIACVEYHHSPGEGDEHQKMVALVATADHLANHYQRTKTIEDYDAEGNTGWPVLASLAGKTEVAFEEVAPSILSKAVEESSESAPTPPAPSPSKPVVVRYPARQSR